MSGSPRDGRPARFDSFEVRRCRVPADLDAVVSFGREERGDLAAAVERIWMDAVALYQTGVHPALQLCLRRDGRVILDRAIGHARGNGPDDDADIEQVLATPATPFCGASAGKGMAATVVLMLAERGALALEDPVYRYIPGYTTRGKDRITIAHVLSHRAGVPVIPRRAIDLDRVDDDEFIRAALCDARPLYRPGALAAYHALSYGFLLREVVLAATGKTIRQVLAEEILDPLGFRWTNFGVPAADVGQIGLSYLTGLPAPPLISQLLSLSLGGTMKQTVEKLNDPRFLTAIIPSSSLVTNATELSRFYELLVRGGELDGVRVLSPQTLRGAVRETARLRPDLGSGGVPVRWGSGFQLGARNLTVFGRDTKLAFGHPGLSNILGWADPERGLAGALMTSGKPVVYPGMARWPGLMDRIAAEVPKLPAAERSV